FRYPRGQGTGVVIEEPQILKIGRGRIIQEGSQVAIISVGTRLQESLKAAKILLENHNIKVTIVDPRFVKPIDKELITLIVKEHTLIITVEENSIGGFSSQFNNFILEHDLQR